MNGKSGSVNVGFQKVLIGVYGNQVFLKQACANGKNQLLQFWNERFMPEAFETRKACLSEILVFCWWV